MSSGLLSQDAGTSLDERHLFLTVTGAASEAMRRHLPAMVEDRLATRIFARDHTLWGPDAEEEAAVRLGWVDAATTSRALVKDILQLRDALRTEGIRRIVLCGMGGSSLAPEVMTRTAGVDLTVLDSTDPDHVRAVCFERLAETAVVVSSKSGSTLETDSHRRIFEHAFQEAGLDAASRIVVVTDPGSPLDQLSREAGYRAVFPADPHVGGRFSALTAFGLVPSGLAGMDIQSFLDEAEVAAQMLNHDSAENVGLALGAILGGTTPLRNKVVIVEDASGIVGFGDWAEQLIAESTGKLGTGILPVAASSSAPEVGAGAKDVLVVRLAGASPVTGLADNEASIGGGLASQMIAWEFATAVAGRLLGINPFDQPDVEAAKTAARDLLLTQPEISPPTLVDGAMEVRGGRWLHAATTAEDALSALLATFRPGDYLSVHAYLDRLAGGELEQLRDVLAGITDRPVTFGWGPRFLHSTGQFHKGGPATGVFLQITGTPLRDLAIPDRPFSFGELLEAQAAGDAQVLNNLGRRVLRLHLTDRRAGVLQLKDILSNLVPGRAHPDPAPEGVPNATAH